ncbi:MAG TPA: amidohydrolase family protein [Longimicrobiaceae bacterium]|nr:amidohydrolase family protein [Longimicrobiaceae bacterium]
MKIPLASPMLARAAILVLALCCVPAALRAQYMTAPAPAAYALEGVTIVEADGTRSENVTVVIRGAFIEEIGEGAAIPADALRLNGDSLTIYPGIVDASGAVDFEFPELEVERDEVQSWAPRRKVQSFQPHLRVVDYMTATDSSLADLRNDGVVATAVHPDGDLMPGRGALLVARMDVESPFALVADPELGPVISLEGSSMRVYPYTLFGVIAFIRQAFEDAQRDGQIQAAFASDQTGMLPPGWDPDYEVLRDVLDGEVPAYFPVDGAADIRRVLGLADDYGFEPVILGGAEAWEIAAILAERDVPVFVSLDFPDPERWDPDDDSGEPLDAAAAAERQRLEEIYANAGRLAAAGVDIALTSGGGEANIREGVRKAIEYGLSEDAALAAVTITPAEHYGISHIVQIEEGMPATFVVTDGPLFGEDSEVVYTFVEGKLERGPEPGEKGVSGEPGSVAGEWDIELSVGGEGAQAEMELTQEGNSFEGTLSGPFGESRITGTVSGTEVNFTMTLAGQGADFSGTLSEDGSEMSGSGSSEFGRITFEATRTSAPGGGR